MTDEFDDFRIPTLHLVIADDEAYWQDQLKGFFAARIDEWSLHRTGQFSFEMHSCGSYEEFTEITGGLLRKGDLVYATVDLVMPYHKADEATDRSVWKNLILWCLDREQDPSGVGDSFEFCVISGEDQMLTDLFQHPRHGVALERYGVKRAFKQQIENGPEVALRKIWEDVRTFVLRNIRFCTVPETWGGTTQTQTIVWFGRHEALFRLLERTDEIARRQKKGDFYIAFADACGYEEHWFRLCCHLKGLEQPHVRNLAETNWRDDGWRRDLRNPPSALFLSHIRGSLGHNVHDWMQKGDFFNALDTARGLACFQFPQLNSDIEADRLLEPEEKDVLQACFTRVHGHSAPFGHGEGSQYRDSDHIIRFPDYETLKAAGVIRATIAFKVRQCQAEHGLDGVPVDPEVLEILAEIPWNEPPARGLDGLSMAISVAYEEAAARKGQLGRDVDLAFFPKEPVQNHFGSSRGFAIRGRRLVRWLDRHWGGGWSTMPAEAVEKQFDVALAGLEQVHELFESLQRLMELADQLQHQGRLEFPEDFPLIDFEALKYAHKFLLSIFRTPSALRKSIDEFRRCKNDRNWPDNYPSLEARDDWRELIEHVQFTWPYRKFRLPTPMDDYLRFSGVIAEIYREMERVLPRHPDLESQWQNLETQRRALEEELQEREVQRRAARRYAREGQSQPVLLLLGARGDEHKLKFTTTLQSFLFFNASLAVCENLYRFNGDFCSTGDVKQFLEHSELGKAIQVLRGYRKTLREAKRLQDSIFRRWVDEWPQSGRQEDAARVIARIAGRTLADADFSKRLKPVQKDLLGRLSVLAQSPSRCPIEDMLAFVGMLRNMFDKSYTQRFWNEQIEDIHDALRGFVLATTDAEFRFGRVSEDGDHALFWSRNRLVAGGGVPQAGEFKGRLCAFDTYGCFPIDDLIRINPDDGSPFAYWSEKWLDLTSTDAAFRPESDSEWLPRREERKSSAVWRWTYEWSG